MNRLRVYLPGQAVLDGWLDLSARPQVLRVPDFAGRYYSVQFTDPYNIDFPYVGTRETGTHAGDSLITGPRWKGQVTNGMKQVASRDNSVLVVGRILVYSDSDLSTAFDLAKQIQLSPFSAGTVNNNRSSRLANLEFAIHTGRFATIARHASFTR